MKLATELSGCSGWAACGYTKTNSAFNRWHTPSRQISPRDYEYLPRLKTHDYHIAVTWHGYAPDDEHPDVYIDGQASEELRMRVADEIREQADIEVSIAEQEPGLLGRYGGKHRHNITNWLAGYQRGIQLEQTRDARTEEGHNIVRGVAQALEQL